MLETGNKHRSLLLRIVNVKNFSWVSSVNKTGKFKIFFVRNKPPIKNIGHKAGTAEDKINLKYHHHLFFATKNQKIITSFPYFQKNFPNQACQ